MRGTLTSSKPMKSLLDVIYERRSVRSYTSRQVDRSTIERLLDAAVQAPSAMNAQPWVFVVLQDRALLDAFAEQAKALYLVEPPIPELRATPRPVLEQFRTMLSEPGYEIFHRAPTLIAIYASSPDTVSDCYLAAANLMLAACDTGLGTCAIGLARPLFNQAHIKAELAVAPHLVAALPIVLGFPAEVPAGHTKRPPSIACWR